MELTQSQIDQIVERVKSQLPDWVRSSQPPNRDLNERMLVVEQELKAQRELMKQGFEAVDKRFEAVDKRFENMQHSMDRRFSTLQWMWGGGVVVITTRLTLYQFLG